MNLKFKIFLVFFITMTQVKAAGDAVTYVFSAGTVIKAEEVNANFQLLADRIDRISTANSATYDYRSYITPITFSQLKYSVDIDVGGSFGGHDTEIHAWNFTGTTRTLTRQRLSGGESGTAVRCHKLTYEEKISSFDLVKREKLAGDCLTLSTTYEVSAGVPILETTMLRGVMFGGGFEATATDSSTGTIKKYYGNDVTTVIKTENVTLTVNGSETTYNACLKIFRSRQFSGWGGDYRRTAWFCPGIGLTKVLETRDNGGSISSRKRELYAVN